MKVHNAALALVGHLNLEAKHVSQLPLQGRKVGIDRLGRLGTGRPGRDGPSRSGLFATCSLFCLPNGETTSDDLPGEGFRVIGRRDRAGVAHRDFASH